MLGIPARESVYVSVVYTYTGGDCKGRRNTETERLYKQNNT